MNYNNIQKLLLYTSWNSPLWFLFQDTFNCVTTSFSCFTTFRTYFTVRCPQGFRVLLKNELSLTMNLALIQ